MSQTKNKEEQNNIQQFMMIIITVFLQMSPRLLVVPLDDDSVIETAMAFVMIQHDLIYLCTVHCTRTAAVIVARCCCYLLL